MREADHIRDCQSCEALLCDYVDRTLAPELRSAVETHLAVCPGCAEFARDAREALLFLRDAEAVEPPPALVNRILYQIPSRSSGWTGVKGWLGRLFAPVLQPRIVMGAMMTVLSLAMMTRCAGVPGRAVTSADLDPIKIWRALDDRAHRTWDRTVKTYESMRVVYELRAKLREWRSQQDEQDSAAADAAAKEDVKTKELTGHSASAPSGTKPDAPAK